MRAACDASLRWFDVVEFSDGDSPEAWLAEFASEIVEGWLGEEFSGCELFGELELFDG